MTRKHYIAFAAALRATRPNRLLDGASKYTTAMRQWFSDRDAIADVLQADNGEFDRERFNRASEGKA